MKDKYKKIVFTLLFPFITLIAFMAVPTGLAVTLPHDIRPVYNSISLEGINQNQMINTVSVVSFRYVTPFSLMLYNMSSRATVREITPFESDLTLAERNRQSRMSMESSVELSIISAFTLASQVNPDIRISYHFAGLRINYRDPIFSQQLNIDDLIYSVNNVSGDHDLMINEFRTQRDLVLQVRRGNTLTSYQILNEGVSWSFHARHIINEEETFPRFQTPILQTFIGGPSGGAMQTLSLYADLVGMNIDQLIVGTGTIMVGGNVGRIGGLRQKVYSAIDNQAKHFFLPASQLNEVLHLRDQINLIPITTISEAIEVLYEIFN